MDEKGLKDLYEREKSGKNRKTVIAGIEKLLPK